MSAPSLVYSVSFGKDSLAMTLELLRRGENVVDIVYFDTGWEFPQMESVIAQFERVTGRKVTRLIPRVAFDYWFRSHKVFHRNSKELRRVGLGWPSPLRRWCTKEKTRAVHTYCNALTWQGHAPLTQCIGYAADEPGRVAKHRNTKIAYQNFRYPLYEWGWTESDALQYCYDAGFDWDGLYQRFKRVSCFCCPLQGLEELRTLRRHYPELWSHMLEMESWLPEGDLGRRFRQEATVSDLDARFAAEDVHRSRQNLLPGMETLHA